MKYRLLDLLCCPLCKHWPLKLEVFDKNVYKGRKLEGKKPLCRELCAFKGEKIEEGKEDYPCDECITVEVSYGILLCEKCGTWYPIVEEIPVMLVPEKRKHKPYLELYEKWKEKAPEKYKNLEF